MPWALKVVDGASAVASEDSGGVGIVDHHDGSIAFGEGGEGAYGAYVAIHGEDPVGNDELLAGLVLNLAEELFAMGDVFVAEDP